MYDTVVFLDVQDLNHTQLLFLECLGILWQWGERKPLSVETAFWKATHNTNLSVVLLKVIIVACIHYESVHRTVSYTERLYQKGWRQNVWSQKPQLPQVSSTVALSLLVQRPLLEKTHLYGPDLDPESFHVHKKTNGQTLSSGCTEMTQVLWQEVPRLSEACGDMIDGHIRTRLFQH